MLVAQNTGGIQWLGPLPTPLQGLRRADLDGVRGLAILLVVVGHVVARDMPAGNDWYAILKDLIYRFHMPLFMTLAGATFGLSVPVFRSWREAGKYSWRKGVRLAVPYFVFGVAIILGKLGAAGFLHVDNPPEGSLSDFAQLLLVPARSAAGFLWFIYVLAIYLFCLPSLLMALRRRPAPLLLAAILAQAVTWPEFLMLDRVMGYLPYYCFGVWACLWREWWSPIPAYIGWPSVVLFATLLAFAIPLEPPYWLVGAASVPALLSLLQRVGGRWCEFWAYVGRQSMPIYLMNTIVIGITKGLMLKILPWDGRAFLVYFPVLVLVGCVVPIFVKTLAQRHTPRIAQFM